MLAGATDMPFSSELRMRPIEDHVPPASEEPGRWSAAWVEGEMARDEQDDVSTERTILPELPGRSRFREGGGGSLQPALDR